MGGQVCQVRQNLPLLPHCEGAIGMDPNHGVSLYGLQLRRQMRRAIRHRIQIRHGAHIAVPTPGGSSGAREYGFFIKKTRLPKMYMHIHKTRQQKTILQLQNRNTTATVGTRLHAGNLQILNQTLLPIHHVCVFQTNHHGNSLLTLKISIRRIVPYSGILCQERTKKFFTAKGTAPD